jgi:hypothetical protein
MKAQIITDDSRQARVMIAFALAPGVQAMRAAIFLRGARHRPPRARIATARFQTSDLRRQAGAAFGRRALQVGRPFAFSEDAGAP